MTRASPQGSATTAFGSKWGNEQTSNWPPRAYQYHFPISAFTHFLANALLDYARALHRRDLSEGFGAVLLPDALARKYPAAEREWGWQWSMDPRTGIQRRHHLAEDGLQRAMKRAIQAAGIAKHGSCPTLRHSFATHLLEDGMKSAPSRSSWDTRT